MILEKLADLSARVDDDLKEEVENVVLAAGRYVQAVTRMEVTARNLAGRSLADKRDEVARTDKERTVAHNAFIDAVDMANRLAATCGMEPIYTGGPERRCYGDFAMAIVEEIFTARV